MGGDRDNRRVGTLGNIKSRKLSLQLWRERRACWRGVAVDAALLWILTPWLPGAARRILAGSN
jgi:hypothetical protein